MDSKAQGAMLILSAIIISSTLTYLITKAKYQKRPITIQPQIKSEPENKGEEKQITVENSIPQQSVSVTEYVQKTQRKYSELTRDYSPDQNDRKEIEIIDVDIFKSNPDVYEPVTYTLYSDGKLTNELNELILNPDDSVGRSTIERFNALEQNGAVYVRNHKTKMDYEILRSLSSYAEARGRTGNGRS